MCRNRRLDAYAIAFAVLVMCSSGQAHVQLDHSQPRVGASVTTVPSEVKIWFTGDVDANGSTIEVVDAEGHRVDKGDTHVAEKDPTLLIVSVGSLKPGSYKVTWHATCTDTHHTHGTFKFTVKKGPS